jgi:hypothetical protein
MNAVNGENSRCGSANRHASSFRWNVIDPGITPAEQNMIIGRNFVIAIANPAPEIHNNVLSRIIVLQDGFPGHEQAATWAMHIHSTP